MGRLTINTEKTSHIILVSAIILLISSLFMPLVLVYLIQDYLYLSHDKWFYVTPPSAYIIFMMGMVWIAIVLLIHLIIKWKFDFRFSGWITLFLMLGSIPFFMFGVSNYYYMDEEGLHFNEEKSFNAIQSYKWEEIKKAEEIFVKNDNGTTVLDQYRFTTMDGYVIDLPYDSKVQSNKFRILEKLQENKIPLTSNMGDLYE
ncbi:hypothetical protein [Mesobacillus subterraneus]|uniref:Uncharacterized protein n=1 Tax=Mesobacillus subterraneus TaxID=285983 RepID=A0A3R9EEW5_9BACI|nr:hypothetical protein [Mesobacillus subterraneus]RSD28835.1 hypothetical protein EJA10_04500 [Mesobacillus subterraneus]